MGGWECEEGRRGRNKVRKEGEEELGMSGKMRQGGGAMGWR